MFDEIRFNTIERLPNYVFAEVNAIKMAARRAGEDIIDFSMGNPDGKTPQHIIDKLCESANKDKTSGYSTSMGIYKLRLAICNWYKRKYNVNLDPENEVVATMGSKEGFVNLARAIINPGDVAIVPTPAYPIHTQAFIIAGGNVAKMPLAYNEKFELDEKRRLLVAELEREEALKKKLQNLETDYEKEKAFVEANPGICDFGLYTEQYLKKKRNLEQQISNTQAKIEQIRDVMADIFKEQKTYSIVDDNRRRRRQKEIDAQEQKMLDEIGTNVYIKKHQE